MSKSSLVSFFPLVMVIFFANGNVMFNPDCGNTLGSVAQYWTVYKSLLSISIPRAVPLAEFLTLMLVLDYTPFTTSRRLWPLSGITDHHTMKRTDRLNGTAFDRVVEWIYFCRSIRRKSIAVKYSPNNCYWLIIPFLWSLAIASFWVRWGMVF